MSGNATADAVPGWPGKVATALAIAITLMAVAWVAGVTWRLGYEVYAEQVLALLLGLALCSVFLTVGAGGRTRPRPPWYDVGLAAIAAAAGLYIGWRYQALTLDLYDDPLQALILGTILVALTAEAVRRTTGWTLLIVFMAFMLYALFGDLVPGVLQGRSTSLWRLMPVLGLDGTATLGAPIEVVSTVVIAFILMGQVLFMAGGGDYFTDLSRAIMGRTRGGAAKIAVVASALFGTISGSVIANVTSTGVVTIGMMKRAGFPPHLAAAVEATASNGGQLMPPVMGAAAFLMADFLGVSYSEVVIAATIPAALYFVAVFLQVDIEAVRRGIGAGDEEAPGLGQVLRQGWIFPIPFAVLLFGMFKFNQPAELAALAAALVMAGLSATIGFRGRRLRLSGLLQSIISTGNTSVQIIVICGLAGAIIGILNVTGLGFGLSFVLVKLGEGSLLLLLAMTGVICIILGMSLPTTSLYILLSTMVAPSLIELGVAPMAAHLFVFYYGMMAFVTPPVAFAAFAAANLAGANPMRAGFTAMRLGWLAYVVPFLFVYSPSLLMNGPTLLVVMSCVTAVAGIWLISAAFMGFLRGRLSPPQRLVAGAAGFALLVPPDMFTQGVLINVIGGIAGAALAWLHIRRVRPLEPMGVLQGPE